MRRARSTLAAAAVATTAGVLAAPAAQAAPGDGDGGLPVQLVAMNDFHGRISTQTGGDGELVTSPGPDGDYATAADNVVERVGGAANVATTLADIRADWGGPERDTFFVGAGDLVLGQAPVAR